MQQYYFNKYLASWASWFNTISTGFTFILGRAWWYCTMYNYVIEVLVADWLHGTVVADHQN